MGSFGWEKSVFKVFMSGSNVMNFEEKSCELCFQRLLDFYKFPAVFLSFPRHVLVLQW